MKRAHILFVICQIILTWLNITCSITLPRLYLMGDLKSTFNISTVYVYINAGKAIHQHYEYLWYMAITHYPGYQTIYSPLSYSLGKL